MRNEENQIQIALVQWLVSEYPNCLFTISPSGMKLPISVAVKLKRMGYRAGTPDILIFEPRMTYHGLFVELKKDKKSNKSKEQRIFREELERRGYYAVFAHGFDEAVQYIKTYLNWS